MNISTQDYDHVRSLVASEAGIILDPGKEYLVEARLLPIVRRLKLESMGDLVTRVRGRRDPVLVRDIVEAMTTNETTFFRDVAPFDTLRKDVLPALIERRRAERKLQIWCAASSTGQEPYSVAMLLAEHFPELESWQVRITATDLSTDVLAKAQAGRYSQLEVNRGLPITYLVKYFEKHGVEWQLTEKIRRRVEFAPLNLVQAWPAMPPADIVLLRNVMIYFDVATKRTILGRVRKLLRPDGYLFLGAAETTINLDEQFAREPFERSGCYRLAA